MSESDSSANRSNVPDHVHSNFATARSKLLATKNLVESISSVPAELSELTDNWLRELFSYEATEFAEPTSPDTPASDRFQGVALVAVGGYGRSELCPGSDIDLLLLYEPQLNTGDLADRIWYPVWDQRLKLGHAVRTVAESIELAAEDLDTSTCLLDARHLAGDQALTLELVERIQAYWRDNSASCLRELALSSRRRQRINGEVAFLLEPNLKLGRGGLRDVHSVRWATNAGVSLAPSDQQRLTSAFQTLLNVRVALHTLTGRSSDLLQADEQQAVAEMLGQVDSDRLMYEVAVAARDVAFISDHAWRTAPSWSANQPEGQASTKSSVSPEESGTNQDVAPQNIALVDGELAIQGDPAKNQLLVLQAAAAAAEHQVGISRESLDLLAERQPTLSDPWPDGARELFLRLLATGEAAIEVVESLDFVNVWTRVLPEWAPNRNRPQRSRYHRFTVDRHLLEAIAMAAPLTSRVKRPDLLLMSALLHDLGKGYPGDHSQVGMGLAAEIAKRCGWNEADTATLVRLVQHHLLLTDTATRRDLDDLRTIAEVADIVEDVDFLELLATLTEADCLATGPTAWTDWIASLVRTLVDLVTEHLTGSGELLTQRRELRSEAVEEMLATAAGQIQAIGADDTVTVVAPDEKGTFSKVAGALALRGLDVLQAEAYSQETHTDSLLADSPLTDSPPARAVSVFRIVPPDSPVDWERVATDIKLAIKGELALDARIAERARLYRSRAALAATTPATVIAFDTSAATDATIVQVRTEDSIGVLYRLTGTLAGMGLDIVSAKIQTMANEVVDTFYVTATSGPTLSPEHQREIELALRHVLEAG